VSTEVVAEVVAVEEGGKEEGKGRENERKRRNKGREDRKEQIEGKKSRKEGRNGLHHADPSIARIDR
jgi:hypothetical protein